MNDIEYIRDPRSGSLILHSSSRVTEFRSRRLILDEMQSLKRDINTLKTEFETLKTTIETLKQSK